MTALRTSLWMGAPALVLALCTASCGGDEQTAGAGGSSSASTSGAGGTAGAGGGGSAQDIRTTHLALDVGALTGLSTLVVQPAEGADAVFLDTSGLTLSSVKVSGADATPEPSGALTRIPVGAAASPVTLEIGYSFPPRTVAEFDGWMPELGVSFVWPYFCGNLFPCNPSMEDGVTFTMDVTGVDPGLTAIFPKTTVSDAPAYMPALAIGNYEVLDLGTTSAGTALSAWYFPDLQSDAAEGTAHLTRVFDFFEKTYGPYAFGPEVRTVSVDWADDSWGGMEHHPYFHVGMFDFWNEEVHAHEAAHAWFGDGVRLACWEDFVLSEGTVTYMAARGLEQVGGPDLWPMYVDDFLVPICTGAEVNTIVLPDTCNAIDFVNDDLWSLATYMKGACFYQEVAELIGADALDEVIGAFYQAHVNQPARMRDMLDALAEKAGPALAGELEARVTDWLLTFECPADYAARCRVQDP